MDGKKLKVGMRIMNGRTKVEVTHVPALDSNDECLFSGKILESDDRNFKDEIGKEFKDEFNSAFSYQAL